MTGRERMNSAMRGLKPDRTPVMCQLALGHYFLNSGLQPVDIWHDSAAFAEALVTMQRRYGFDGILVNLPGRDPRWRESVVSLEARGGSKVVTWSEGFKTIVPPDDNPRVVGSNGRKPAPPLLDSIDPQRLFYIEPHDRFGVVMLERFPEYQLETLKRVRTLAREVSIHGEIFSPLSQMLELLGPAEGMLALADDPEKMKRCFAQLVGATSELALLQLRAGADAVLMSSAFAGAGFISPRHYEEFVLPFEKDVIARIKSAAPDSIVYTHTCGAIGDRLELIESTGTDGIDTLDPPPLGDVDLADARRRLAPRTFIKGNIDPVNTLLRGTPEECRRDALERIDAAGPLRYILSSACSVSPRTPAANIDAIVAAAKESPCVA